MGIWFNSIFSLTNNLNGLASQATNSEYQGSVHGAIISGHEAAKECQGLLEGEDFIGIDDDAEEKRFWGDFCKEEEGEEEDEL